VVKQGLVWDWDKLKQGLADSVTIIVGGARGTGKQAALSLLQLGGSVAIGDINRERLDKTMAEFKAAGHTKALAVPTDITKPDEVRNLVDQTVKHFGKLDNVVFAAGAYRAQKSSLETDLEEWRLIVDSNLTGAFLIDQAAIPHMIKAGGGNIVHISSNAGRTVSTFLGCHYTAAKSGILGLTRHFAKEFGDKGIRVNSIAPGGVVGERMTDLITELHREQMLVDIAKNTPLGRNVEERDVVGAILFLLSDLSGFITGASLDVTGGIYML
jgi:NAD(P)-dependent dehydrogenase (short-subunit alcohol dehydrogenase family)